MASSSCVEQPALSSLRVSALRFAVFDDDFAPKNSVANLAGHAASCVRGVAAQAGQAAGIDGPAQRGIEDGQVRWSAGFNGSAVAVAEPGDSGWTPRQQGHRRHEVEIEFGERESQGCLQAEHAGRGAIEWLFLGMGRMRCVIGPCHVDASKD